MPKTSNWSPAEDNYIKSELIKKISSDLKSHTITVQVPSASTAHTITTTPLQPQLPNPNDNEEEYSDPSESESDEDSKSNSSLKRKSPLKKQKLHDLSKAYKEPTEHLHTTLEFFTQRLKLNDPIMLPLEDGSFKLVFGYPPFDIEIIEVKYLGDGRIGIKYHILLPSREDLETIVGYDYSSRWYIKYDCLPLKTTIFHILHHSASTKEQEKYQSCKIDIEKDIKYFSLTVTPKAVEKIDLDEWIDS
ncbi:hypothetical protein ACTFIZ_002304 [Dictyostelium cf. discoideum]